MELDRLSSFHSFYRGAKDDITELVAHKKMLFMIVLSLVSENRIHSSKNRKSIRGRQSIV